MDSAEDVILISVLALAILAGISGIVAAIESSKRNRDDD